MENKVTGKEIQLMVGHWLQVPEGGYLGSRYGNNTKSLLQLPQNEGSADEYLDKLKEDVPILQALPDGTVNLYGIHTRPDRLDIAIEVAGDLVPITTI